MKSSELHRIISQNGWILVPGRGKGSHTMYMKNGKLKTVPFHKGKEISNSLARSILKSLNIIYEES